VGHTYRKIAAASALVFVLGACGGGSGDGGSSKKDDPSSSSTSSSVLTGSDAGTAAGGPGDGTQATSGGQPVAGAGNGTGNGGGTTASRQKPPLPLKATLASTCVKAGGQQTIRIEAPHMSAIGYDSVYPDGKSGISEGFYGGSNGGHSPPEGQWTDTWTIAPHAPPGKVKVTVLGNHIDYEGVDFELVFDLVPLAGSCP
jgi:hypothetical protein